MEKEKWKQIRDYPRYSISNYGRVKSKTEKIKSRLYYGKNLKLSNSFGYKVVRIRNEFGQKSWRVHRLVGFAFVKGYTDKKNMINHIDGIRDNNYYKNLEWVTNSQNILHSYRVLKNKSYLKGISPLKNIRSKKLFQYSKKGKLIKVWPYIQKAERELGLYRGAFANRITDGKRIYKNYKWTKEIK